MDEIIDTVFVSKQDKKRFRQLHALAYQHGWYKNINVSFFKHKITTVTTLRNSIELLQQETAKLQAQLYCILKHYAGAAEYRQDCDDIYLRRVEDQVFEMQHPFLNYESYVSSADREQLYQDAIEYAYEVYINTLGNKEQSLIVKKTLLTEMLKDLAQQQQQELALTPRR